MRGRVVRAPALGTVAIVALVGLLLVPTGSARGTPSILGPLASTPGGTQGSVHWGGVDIGRADTPAKAFSIEYSNHVDVQFFWNSTGPNRASPVQTARIEMIYFSTDLSVTDAAPNTSHSASMVWNGAGTLRWFLAGTYALSASLIDANGSTLWNERFFVHVTAPYTVLAAVPILLLVLLALELVAVARSGYDTGPPARGLRPHTPPTSNGRVPVRSESEGESAGPPEANP